MASNSANVKSRRQKAVTKTEVRQMIRGSLNSALEHKRYVITFNNVTTTTAGSLSPITQNIVVGDTILTRDGAQIVVKSLIVRHRLLIFTGVATTQRIIIFSDSQAHGTTPSVTDVLDTANWISGFNTLYTQQKRYKIYHDSIVSCVTGGSNMSNEHVWKFKPNRRVSYDADTNVSGANGKNAMWVLFIADNATATYDGSYEIEFTDA